MLTVGMFPMIFAVIITMFAPQSEAAAVPVCYLSGGLLCAVLGKKMLNLDTGSCFRKPEPAAFALVIIAGLGWSLADIFIANRSAYMNSASAVTGTKELIEMGTTVFICPVAEELIFRLGMMTVLLIGAGKSGFKKFAAAVISCAPWVFIHFPKTAVRAADIIAVGAVISLIYILSKNIVYCIAFHMAANFLTMLAVPFSRYLLAHEFLMIAGILTAAVCLPAALMKMHSRGRCVSFQPMSSIVRA